jgi:hypothetical protein
LRGTVTCRDAKGAEQLASAVGARQKQLAASGIRDLAVSTDHAEVTVTATVEVDALRRSVEKGFTSTRKR